MHSKARIGGHPLPLVVVFPVVSYTGALVGFAIYAANGHQLWLNLAIALSIAGAASAMIGAQPGFVDLGFVIPRRPQAARVDLAHAALNDIACGLLIASRASYVGNWNGPLVGVTLVSAADVEVTVIAGALA